MVGNLTRKRDGGDFRGFLPLARRHIPQLTGTIGCHRALAGGWGHCGFSLPILTTSAFFLGRTPDICSFHCLFILHACLRITGALVSFLDTSDCVEKQTIVWNCTDMLSISKVMTSHMTRSDYTEKGKIQTTTEKKHFKLFLLVDVIV